MEQIKTDVESFARIRVIGAGGSGSNAVNHMVASKVKGVEFIAINSDAQDLHHSLAKKKIHIGKNLDRSSRTLFYQAISCDFQHLEARTIKVGEDQVIDLRFRRSSKKRKVRCDESSGNAEACLPSSAKETITLHLAFTLLKQDTDHASAIEAVAAALQLPSTAITYAGMKDRRAITAQRVVASLSVLSNAE